MAVQVPTPCGTQFRCNPLGYPVPTKASQTPKMLQVPPAPATANVHLQRNLQGVVRKHARPTPVPGAATTSPVHSKRPRRSDSSAHAATARTPPQPHSAAQQQQPSATAAAVQHAPATLATSCAAVHATQHRATRKLDFSQGACSQAQQAPVDAVNAGNCVAPVGLTRQTRLSDLFAGASPRTKFVFI